VGNDPVRRSGELRQRRAEIEARIAEVHARDEALKARGIEVVTEQSVREATEAARASERHAHDALRHAVERHEEAADVHERTAAAHDRQGATAEAQHHAAVDGEALPVAHRRPPNESFVIGATSDASVGMPVTYPSWIGVRPVRPWDPRWVRVPGRATSLTQADVDAR
jgi:hypothetical protein